jgi:cell division protein FtsB
VHQADSSHVQWRTFWLTGLLSALVLGPGCTGAYVDKIVQQQIELDRAQEENNRLKSRVAELERDARGLSDQIANLDATRANRRQFLVAPAKIELGPLTGGRSFDNRQGDDGLRVYVFLLDAAGDKVKQAGRTEIEAFDLEEGGRRLGRWTFDEKATAAAWLSALSSYYYVFDCPWQGAGGRPRRNAVTVRAKFTDLLTGRTFEDERRVEVELPAGSPAPPNSPAAPPTPPPPPAATPAGSAG